MYTKMRPANGKVPEKIFYAVVVITVEIVFS